MRRNGHKFNAVRTEVDGYQFASKAEAKHYAELRLLEKAGLIRGLRLQPVFWLSAKTGDPIGKYVADFVYEERIDQDWCIRIVDVKGVKTDLYRWKKKHFELQYGITITEITR